MAVHEEVHGFCKNGCKVRVPTLSQVYPVGSVYETTSETNPAVVFGGTWELIEKNHPVYSIVDSIVKQGNGADFVDLISWSQIVMAFQERYNITPKSQDTSNDNGNANTVFVDVANGHEEASYVRLHNISWHSRNSERVVVAVFDRKADIGQRIRINFKMSYVDRTVIYYKWKRVE